MSIWGFGISKISTFFFLHKEIIKILDAVFTGFNPHDHVFFQPDSALFADKYDLLLSRYSKLFQDNEVERYIDSKNYVITSVSCFNSLTDNFIANIQCWHDEKSILLKEKEFIERLMPYDTGIENDVKLAAYELERFLPEHVQQKESYLASIHLQTDSDNTKVYIDVNTAKLHLLGKEYDIQPASREYVFLRLLTDRHDTVVTYKEIADATGLNANTPFTTNADIAQNVQDLKTILRSKLSKLHIKKNTIDKVLHHIKPVLRSGYKFVTFR